MKNLLVLVFTFTSLLAHAGKDPYMRAVGAYNEYRKTRDAKDLQIAHDNIDLVIRSKDRTNEPKVWALRGEIYFSVYSARLSELERESGEISDQDKRTDAYVHTPDSLLNISTGSFLQALWLDSSKQYSERINKGLSDCYYASTSAGFEYHRQGNDSMAAACFVRSYEVSGALNTPDSLMLYNAAYASYQAKLFPQTIQLSGMLVSMRYQEAAAYWFLVESYLQQGDTMRSWQMLDSGQAEFPGDRQLKLAKLDVLLAFNHVAEADSMVKSMYADTGSWSIPGTFLIIGNLYDQLANPVGSDGAEQPKPWNYETLCQRAEANYLKALELNPELFDARYNLAVLYYNQGVHCYNLSYQNNADDRRMDKRWPEYFNLAVVEFERARLQKPNDLNVLQGLSLCYAGLGDTEKYKELRARIRELEK